MAVRGPCQGEASASGTRPGNRTVGPEMAERALSGEPLTRIANDLNARGIRTRTGVPWSLGAVRRTVVSPTYAGLRVHQGKVLENVRADWEPIISRDLHDQLSTPGRRGRVGELTAAAPHSSLEDGIRSSKEDPADGRVFFLTQKVRPRRPRRLRPGRLPSPVMPQRGCSATRTPTLRAR
ncbi:recombinase family protein [Saccharopolyspora spinosa]|uniref:recombinase family protein n=1 Tax=Saccharopolyspora spinosa TaxID=60894 RepID=UPI000A0733AC